MIVFCVAPCCVVIAADRYQKLQQNGGPPIENNKARKLVLSPNGRIAVGVCGDLPLLPNAEMAKPELWFERHFSTNRYVDPAIAAQAFMDHLKKVPPPAWCAGGNIFVGGFVGKKATVLELRCESESRTELRLVVKELNRISTENGVVFGSIGGYSTFDGCRDAAGVAPWDGSSDLCNYCKAIIDGVAAAFAKDKKAGVSGPAECVLVPC